MTKTTVSTIVAFSLISGNLAIAQDETLDEATLERGQDVYDICSACHAEQGEGSEDLYAP